MGNDIVDRNVAGGRGKSRDLRFLARVFALEERAAIKGADDPDGMLCALWAAKEGAYKMESAFLGPQVFAHRLYACRIVSRQAGERGLPARVVVTCPRRNRRHGAGATLALLQIEANEHWVHAHGFAKTLGGRGPDAPPSVYVAGRRRMRPSHRMTTFTEPERRSIRSRSSADVRLAAKEALAACLKIDRSRLEIIRPTVAQRSQPPYLLLDGERSEISLSLSHHGDWVSWCFGLPAADSE